MKHGDGSTAELDNLTTTKTEMLADAFSNASFKRCH